MNIFGLISAMQHLLDEAFGFFSHHFLCMSGKPHVGHTLSPKDVIIDISVASSVFVATSTHLPPFNSKKHTRNSDTCTYIEWIFGFAPVESSRGGEAAKTSDRSVYAPQSSEPADNFNGNIYSGSGVIFVQHSGNLNMKWLETEF